MQRIMGLMRKAMEQYHMIEEGDVVAVGVSGGKDSMCLLSCLAQMRRYYGASFSIKAILLDPCFGGIPMDAKAVSALDVFCQELEVNFLYRKTNIGTLAFAEDVKYHCSFCSKLRRGVLVKTAVEEGCTKLALGHHRDDVAETFYMNLLDQGSLGCFSPVTHLSDSGMTVIRPMVLVPEQDITAAASRNGLPVLKSTCPVDKATERERMKSLLHSLQETYPALPQNVLSILMKNHIAGW